MAMLLCRKCELQFDDGLRLPKALPCGHMACLACLEECARTGGSMCPVCRKVFKSNIDELLTLQNPKANPVWCRDCEAEAKAACFEQHVLCGLGRMQRETAVELEAAWADRAALLNTLAEDVRVEKQQLKQERDSGNQQQQQQGLAALRGVLAAAKEHPLRGLPAGHDGVHVQGGLLRRALGALRKEEELRAREAAFRDKEVTLAKWEAALEKRASTRARTRRLAAPRLQRGRNRGGLSPSEREELESATAAQASSCSDDSSDISSEEGDNAEGQPALANDSSTDSSDESITLEPALPRQAPEVASAGPASQSIPAGDSSFDSADDSDEILEGLEEATPSPSAPSGSDQEATGEKPGTLDSSMANDEHPAPPTVPGMDSLPEELLQRILALVPLWWSASAGSSPDVPDLLQLRLVCRRWARSVLSPQVWWHRELDYNFGCGKPPYQLLGRLPVVGKLRCFIDSKRRDEVLSLMKSPMRVRSLHLTVYVTQASCALAKRLLDKKRCEELNLTLVRRFSSMTKTTWLLQQVDSLQGLKALTLSHSTLQCHNMEQADKLNHTFRQLTGLTKLSLGSGLHLDTVRSMLEASKHTLRELDCGYNDMPQLVASTASQLRCIRVAAHNTSESLMHLQELGHLEVLDVSLERFTSGSSGTQSRQSDIVSQLLNSSPSVPREVHLTLNDFQGLHHWNTTEGMRRVSRLTIICTTSYWRTEDVREDSHFLTVPLTLPNVMKLELNLGQDENALPRWRVWRAVWLHSSAPKLREVHVVQGWSRECCLPCKEWLRVLREKRPHLKICVRKEKY